MTWYTHQPKKAGSFLDLASSYNKKYGNYDYTQDSRTLDTSFEECLLIAVGDISGKKVIVCGANSGYEIKILAKYYPDAKFTALDISDAALRKIPKVLKANLVHANMESLPFADKSFDSYINCRGIQSSNVNLGCAIDEAVRVTKENIIISIPNGYVVQGKLVNGLYSYASEKIEKGKPKRILTKITHHLGNSNGFAFTESSSVAEFFLTASRS